MIHIPTALRCCAFSFAGSLSSTCCGKQNIMNSRSWMDEWEMGVNQGRLAA